MCIGGAEKGGGGRAFAEYMLVYLLACPVPHNTFLSVNRLKLVLGQPSDSTGEYFQGEISQANVFTRALNQSQISTMGSNCSIDQLVGDMYAWPLSDAYLVGEVSVVTPALCGRSRCPPGFYGSYCDLERGNKMMRLTKHIEFMKY